MTDTIHETWEQRSLREIAESEARGEARGEARASREALLVLLEDRFGNLPESIREQIEGVKEPDQLKAALRQALHISTLSEFTI